MPNGTTRFGIGYYVDDASGNITEWMNTSSDGISWSNTNLNQVSATSFTLHAFDGDYAGMAATQDGGFWPTPDRGDRHHPVRSHRAVVTMKTIASCVALVALALLVLGACSINVESDEHAARAFCNSGYGLVRPGSKFAGGVPGYFQTPEVMSARPPKSDTCAATLPKTRPAVSAPAHPFRARCTAGQAASTATRGRLRGRFCKPNEICAMHNTADCKATCCDMATDPDCGVPLKKCFVES